MQVLILAGCLAIGQADRPLSPADAIEQAHADLLRMNTGRDRVRYLSLYKFPLKERDLPALVLSGHCNHLSSEPIITRPAAVPGSAGALLRVNLDDYGWSASVWEKLTDPYFTATIETETVTPWEGGYWKGDGRSYNPGAFTYYKKVKTLALAPWLTETEDAKRRLAEVVAMTGSKIPVVSGDWFFNQTAAAADRTPNYYDFLGVKDEKTFQARIGADVKLAEKFGAEIREAVADSGVTLQPRAIARHGTIAGGYWRSFDVAIAKDNKNPLRVLGRDFEKEYDASEQFGTLPNGFWATGLFNKQGVIQATAPDNIASDSMSRSNDRRVHVNVSCIRCHANGGLQDIDGWVRNLISPPLELRSPDYEKARELRRQYAEELEPFLGKDRAIYERAVKKATGLDSKKYAFVYGEFWERYEDGKIGIDEAARDLGVATEVWRKALDASVRAGKGDTALSAMLLPAPRKNRVSIRVWEESYSAAHLILRGYQQ